MKREVQQVMGTWKRHGYQTQPAQDIVWVLEDKTGLGFRNGLAAVIFFADFVCLNMRLMRILEGIVARKKGLSPSLPLLER